MRGRDATLLSVENLVVEFPVGNGLAVHAVSDVSFDVAQGETLGLVGESGCGKSTTSRAIMMEPRPTSGSVWFDDIDLTALPHRELRRVRPRLQLILQDPISSLNPRRKVKHLVGEGLRIWHRGTPAERAAKVNELMESVGLDPAVFGDRRAHELSGGQCQRVCIARALALDPEVLLCDEPVSALDVSVQTQIVNLIERLKAEFGLTVLFVSHDLAVVKNVSDRVLVMYLGKICELADPNVLYAHPAHPYTTVLLASIPEPEPGLAKNKVAIVGELPSPLFPPSGCRFRTRCPRAAQRCTEEEPVLREYRPGHYVACHFPNPEPTEA